MSDLKQKAKLETSVIEESVCAILNTPEVIRYKDTDGKIKLIEINRINVFSLEKAIQPIFKLLSLVDLETGEFMIKGLASLIQPGDMYNLKQVVVSCLNVDMEKFNSFSASFFLKIFNKWLSINRDEVREFSKAFLLTREEITKYKEVLDEVMIDSKVKN